MLTPLVDGHWVSEEYAQIAEIIHDYDKHLQLAWIPPEQRNDKTPPFAVLETSGDGQVNIVFTIKENELDHRVLARLFAGDTHNKDVMAMLESDEAARKALELKKKMEIAEERRDIISTIVKSPLHTFRHNGHKFQ